MMFVYFSFFIYFFYFSALKDCNFSVFQNLEFFYRLCANFMGTSYNYLCVAFDKGCNLYSLGCFLLSGN